MIWIWLGGALVGYQAVAMATGRVTRISHLPVPDVLPVVAFLVALIWHIGIEPKEGR